MKKQGRTMLLGVALVFATAAACGDDDGPDADVGATGEITTDEGAADEPDAEAAGDDETVTEDESVPEPATEPEPGPEPVATAAMVTAQTFIDAILASDHETVVATLDEGYGLTAGPGGLSPAQFWTGQTAYGPFDDSEVNCESGPDEDTAICEAKTTDRLGRGLGYRLVWDFTITANDGQITDIQFAPNDGVIFVSLFQFTTRNDPTACAPVSDATVLTDPDGVSPIGTACADAMVDSIPAFAETETFVLPVDS